MRSPHPYRPKILVAKGAGGQGDRGTGKTGLLKRVSLALWTKPQYYYEFSA